MGRPVKPGPIVVPQCCEIKLIWSDGSFEWANVVHGSTGGTTTINAALAETLLSGFKTGMTSSGWVGRLAVATSLVRVSVKDLNAAHMSEFLSTGAGLPGSDASGAMPINVALVASLLTQKSGAENRGRIYFGGLGASVANDNRHHTQLAGTDAVAFVNAIMSTMAGAQVPMVIANRELLAGTDSKGNALPPRQATTIGVTGAKITSDRLDTQRRRLGRR